MVNHILKNIDDTLFNHYKMAVWDIGEYKFLLDTSLGEIFCNRIDFKLEDIFNEKSLPRIKDKSDKELAKTLYHLLGKKLRFVPRKNLTVFYRLYSVLC